ncbi:nucleotide sugar dehydrogenase [Rhodoplanes sp. TEM]|uniref:UDP-glucose 6-dehydrogenase n=1 Tax=Rhodoplanes tepidamans TaxID=200616 RepID=A0ABT5JJ92_RHOTP|nr:MULTISPECIES: nucleotide sugar dehydrogenase [Rhodoplanes]MDC7789438.1 nucleotide sugar dehydrogenase [Rhodoplanes tepidamans]MDC7985425.1 nucleotide sugar dehydrogenase [Rhodoplanes sp. TEM]MDQ0353612.1 GDP-mannose 6-dehydrogenase [Rhodoplanes tepidamans]
MSDFNVGLSASQQNAVLSHPPLSVVGLGYVGAVSAACFAELRHQVVGVDIDSRKTSSLRDGRAPLLETDLDSLIGTSVREGRLTATTDIAEAVARTSITFVCVGTPSDEDGSVDLTALEAVAAGLGRALAAKNDYHLVVIRSTIPIGTTRNVVLPILEAESRKRCGEDFGLCFHPEFLREGVAIADFFAPPKTVIGGYDDRSAQMLAALYGAIQAPLVCTSIESAELVKYVDNTWHAVKVSFANEVGRICRTVGVDSHDVMNIFVQDRKLNLSAYYMKPGFAFGGSCLPKDVRAMQGLAESRAVRVPLIESLLSSNDCQIGHAAELIEKSGARRVGILGLTFKDGTDDLRESPQIDLVGRLSVRGFAVRAYDSNVTTEGLALATAHAKAAKPDMRNGLRLLPYVLEGSAEELVAWADVIVVCHRTGEFVEAVEHAAAGKTIVDLVRLPDQVRSRAAYAGVCW